MKHTIIANWKMNPNFNEAIALAKEIEKIKHGHNFLLATPSAYLAYFKNNFNFNISAQDVSIFNEFGAYTGETSADLIKSFGINYSIIGHSERRSLMFETNKIVRKKIENCINANITPIVCVGETLESRQNNTFKELLLEQINSIPENAGNIILAYEPFWAIGSGIIPTIDEIKQVTEFIKTNDKVSIVAKNAQLVYGGSVSCKNFNQIIDIPEINGVLIGSASLKIDELKTILNY